MCQICYNSDHHLIECPLPHVKIGGVPLVSAVSRGLVSNRKPAERRGWEDDSLKEVKGGSAARQAAPGLDRRTAPADPIEVTDDVVMDSAFDGVPLAADDGLAAARAQFNNPFSQLKSLFPYMSDERISA